MRKILIMVENPRRSSSHIFESKNNFTLNFFQIIASIVQGVSATFPTGCTWEEALVFRRDHIGGPEQAVRSLVYLKNQMRYQQGLQANPGLPGNHYYPRFPSPLGGAPGPVHNGMVQHPGPYMSYGYQPHMGYFPNPGLPHPMQQSLPPHAGFAPNGVSNGHVPTAKLVDLAHDVRQTEERNSSGSSTSTVTGRAAAPIPLTIKHLEEENKRKSMMLAAPEMNGRTGTDSLENWDYVYRQLENIGYTKDQVIPICKIIN